MPGDSRVKKFFYRANEQFSVSRAAWLLAGSTLIASVLGLLRERLLLANFGISADVDAYKAAFTLPDFMFILLTSGALSVTFIPVFVERITSGNKASAWQLSNSILNLFALVTGLTSIVIMIFASPIIEYIVAPGLSPDDQQLAADMMRIIALNPLLFSISSVLTSIQQSVGRFFFYALAPALYNIGIILGIIFIAPHYGIMGVAIGVLIGSIIQMLVSIVGMIGLGFNYEPTIYWRNQGFAQVFRLMPPRALDQGADYINILVETNLASRLKEGAITAYQTAFTLHMVPITLIGVAISTAAFPQLSRRLAQHRPDLFKRDLTSILRVIIWLVLPTSVIAYFGRGYLVRLVVADGNPEIATLLGLLVIAIAFRSVFHLLTRSYYAQQDTKTPLYISLIAIALNIALAVLLAQPDAYGIYGLALAQSISTAFEALVLIFVLARRFDGLVTDDLVSGIIRMLVATAATAFVTYLLIAYVLPLQASDVGFFALVPKFILTVTASFAFYISLSYLLGLREASPIIERIKNTIFRPMRVEQ